jgi:hypothetical protein
METITTTTTIIMEEAATAPTEAALHALGVREHSAGFTCRPAAQGGLGLRFTVQSAPANP